MRVLAITNLYPNPYQPNRGTFNRRQLAWLARRHEVVVIAPILWGEERAARLAAGRLLPEDRRVERDGLVVDHPRYLYTPKVLRGWYGRFFRWSIRPAFERALAECRPDLIFAPWAYPDGWAAVELGREAGLPVVVKVHGSDVLGLPGYPRRRGPTLHALRAADRVVAVSRDLAGRVAAMGVDPGKVCVIYDGVDPQVFRPGPAEEARARLGLPRGRRLVLFVGNLVPVKGLDILLSACEALASEGFDFDCRLIGDGPLRPALASRIDSGGMAGRVVLHGPVPHEGLGDWYRAADLLALSSRSEGVPVVLLEASACGLPFVATDVGGIPEVAHLGAVRLVPPGDPVALAEAIREGLARPRTGTEEAPRPRSHEDAAEELAELFENLLSRRRPEVPATE